VVRFSGRRRHSIQFRSGFFVVASDSEDRIAIGEDRALRRNLSASNIVLINQESASRYLVNFIVPGESPAMLTFARTSPTSCELTLAELPLKTGLMGENHYSALSDRFPGLSKEVEPPEKRDFQ
jgi:hypothetical protein